MIISGNVYSERIEIFKQRGSEITILDTVENYKIVIDTSHLFVSVFNQQNTLIWKNYASRSSYCISCTEPNEIYTVELKILKASDTVSSENPEMGIYVTHTNCVSYFKLKTGEYNCFACD
jgi:hypothetical protein